MPVDWTGVAAVPVQHVNQMLAQIGSPAQDGIPDGVYLTLGSAEPPLVFGNEEDRQRALEDIGALRVTVHGRFHISRSQLSDLIQVLEKVAAQHDGLVQGVSPSQVQDQR
jgi:hypothetical protein